jgi:hypothetical protein
MDLYMKRASTLPELSLRQYLPSYTYYPVIIHYKHRHQFQNHRTEYNNETSFQLTDILATLRTCAWEALGLSICGSFFHPVRNFKVPVCSHNC